MIDEQVKAAALSAEELAKLLGNTGLTVQVRGEDVLVSEFRWADLYDLSVLTIAMARDLVSPEFDLLALMQKHKDKIDALMTFSTGRPLDWIQALPMSAGFALAEATFQVNADFFFRRVLQLLRESISLAQRHMAVPPPPGSAPSSSPAPAPASSETPSSDSASGPDAPQS